MLNMPPASLRLGAMLLVATPALGAEPLTWKWAEGDSVRYQTTQTMRMTMDAGPAGKMSNSSRHDTVMRWSVDSVGDEGAATLRQETERVVMQNKNPIGQGFRYDSDDEDPPAGMAALVAPMFDAMVEHPFLLTMLPTGEITDIQLSDELSKAFDRLPGGGVSGEMVAQLSKQNALKFPAEPLAVGDDWSVTMEVDTPQMGAMKVVTTYVYDGPREVDGHEYEAFTPSVKIESAGNGQGAEVAIQTKDSAGEVLFDRAAGRVFRSRLLQTMAVRVKIGDQEVVNDVEQAVEMRQLGENEAPDLAEEEEAEAETGVTENAAGDG